MSLRALAESDLEFLVEDDSNGWAMPIELKDPAEKTSVDLRGLSNDIYEAIDPDLGIVVSGRTATVTIRISTLVAQGFTLPVGIVKTDSRPWTVEFKDLAGNDYLFKVVEARPDRGVGVVTCILEAAVDDS